MALSIEHLIGVELLVQQEAERLHHQADQFSDSSDPDVQAHVGFLKQRAAALEAAAGIVIAASVSWDSLGPILRRNHQLLTAEHERIKAAAAAAKAEAA